MVGIYDREDYILLSYASQEYRRLDAAPPAQEQGTTRWVDSFGETTTTRSEVLMGFMDDAKKMADDAATKAKQVASDAKEKSGPTLDKAKATAGEWTDKAKATAARCRGSSPRRSARSAGAALRARRGSA